MVLTKVAMMSTQRYETRISQLIVSGCSFTHNNHDTHVAWPNILEAWSDMQLTNLAVPGAGNTHIANSIILHLEKNKPNPSDTLVMVMWTGPERIDWITDKESSKFKDAYPFTYDYDDNNELVLGGAWWGNKPRSDVENLIIQYSKYQSDSSLALTSWLAMQSLTNYLEQNGYDYIYTSIADLDGAEDANRWIQYTNELSEIGLSVDNPHWIQPFLYEHGKTNNVLMDDNFHVHWQGHESWVTDVLVPRLQQAGVITNEL